MATSSGGEDEELCGAATKAGKENSTPVFEVEETRETRLGVGSFSVVYCATLDGEGRSRIFYLSGECSIELEGLRLVNGYASGSTEEDVNGGAVLSYFSGGSLWMSSCRLISSPTGPPLGAAALAGGISTSTSAELVVRVVVAEFCFFLRSASL